MTADLTAGASLAEGGEPAGSAGEKEDRPEPDAAAEAWARMQRMAHDPAVIARLHEIAEEAGVTPGVAKATLSLSSDEPAPMRALAVGLHCDNSYVTAVVDGLEAAGLAVRQAHPTDRRVKVVALTEEGRRLTARVRALVETPPAAFSALSAQETLLLRDLMRKLDGQPLVSH